MRSCLVVTTYERPDALARVLASLAAQSNWPDEVIVADDGSGPATRIVIERFASTAPRPVRHVWQPHAGFRAGRVRNLAVARTAADYVILLDGDMVMHPWFVADHLDAARDGCWHQGVRVALDEPASVRLLASAAVPRGWWSGLGLRRVYAARSPLVSRFTGRIANAVIAVKSCNQGFWRRHLLAANGFDETMIGWGSEDKELCARLANAGIARRTLLFRGIAFHLAHPPAARDGAAANRDRWQATVQRGRTRCDAGIDQHLPP